MPVIHASHPCKSSMPSMIEISSCMNSVVIWPPPHTKLYQQSYTKPYHNSSLYLQLIIITILIHKATLLSRHFWKIATVSHFRLVYLEGSVFTVCLWLIVRVPVQWRSVTKLSFVFHLKQRDQTSSDRQQSAEIMGFRDVELCWSTNVQMIHTYVE